MLENMEIYQLIPNDYQNTSPLENPFKLTEQTS